MRGLNMNMSVNTNQNEDSAGTHELEAGAIVQSECAARENGEDARCRLVSGVMLKAYVACVRCAAKCCWLLAAAAKLSVACLSSCSEVAASHSSLR